MKQTAACACLLVMAFPGCSSETSRTCGPGTVAEGDTCVVAPGAGAGGASGAAGGAGSGGASAGAAGMTAAGAGGDAGASGAAGMAAAAGSGGGSAGAGGMAGGAGGPGPDDDPCPPPGIPLWDCSGQCAPVAPECVLKPVKPKGLPCGQTLSVDFAATPVIYIRTPPNPHCLGAFCDAAENASIISVTPTQAFAEMKATVAAPWTVQTTLGASCVPPAPLQCWGPGAPGKIRVWDFSTSDKASPARNIRLEHGPNLTCP